MFCKNGFVKKKKGFSCKIDRKFARTDVIQATFHVNWMLFTIQSINTSFMHYFKLQKFEFKQLIDNMTINL